MDDVISKKWEEALSLYGDTVYRLALLRTGHKEDAEDITQTVFLKYAETLAKKKKFASEAHIKAWLLRVTINQSKNLFASAWSRHRAAMTEEMEHQLAAAEPAPREIYLSVLALPEKYRTVMHLYYYEGYSVKEICDLLGKKENTVKSLLNRGRDQLRKEIR